MFKIFISLLGYNHKKYLALCLKAVLAQDYHNFKIVYFDNASGDGSVDLFKSSFVNRVEVVASKENLGYAEGHNLAIKMAVEEGYNLVMCLNPDVILEPNFLSEIVKVFQNDKVGAVSGKLLKWRYESESVSGEITKVIKTKVIDSTGLKLNCDRSVIDRGEGEVDKRQYDKSLDVFGVSGAAPVYRLLALTDVKYKGTDHEYFDADFFVYKEDVDLAYRLQLAGWQARFKPGAVAFHQRQMGLSKKIIKNKQEQGRTSKYYSWQNNLFLIGKNEFWQNLLPHLHLIIWRQIKILGYVLVCEPSLLYVLFKALCRLPCFIRKRRLMKITISGQEFRRWLR